MSFSPLDERQQHAVEAPLAQLVLLGVEVLLAPGPKGTFSQASYPE
jgi:hypothetical protein